MIDALAASVNRVLARAPEWIRHNLVSSEASTRSRAEEALAAMIAAAMQAEPVVAEQGRSG